MVSLIHISYVTAGRFNQVGDAVQMANELLQNEGFFDRIAAHPCFDLANTSPSVVAELMRSAQLKMKLDLYYSLSPSKNIDGYDYIDDPSVVHTNVWKLQRSAASICNTIIHSCVHAVNALYPQYSFGHGDMLLAGKENTAPYWIGALAQKMVSAEDTLFISLEHDTVEPRIKAVRERFAGFPKALF